MGLELRKQLRLLPTTISLLGKDQLLRDEATQDILAILAPDPDLRDFNVDYIQSDAATKFKSVLSEEPVGDHMRVIFLDSSEPDSFIKHKAQRTVLIATGRNFKESQLEIDCRRLYGQKLRHWIRSEAKRQQLPIDKQDVEALVANNPPDLQKLRDEILKLSLTGTKPNQDTIKALSHSALNTTGWEITKHITHGRVSQAVETLSSAKQSGLHTLQIISLLQTLFKNLKLVEQRISPEVPDYELERLKELQRKTTPKQLDLSLQDLIDAEYRAKTGLDTQLTDVQLVIRLTRRFA